MIQRPDVEELLRRNGDYLLRKTDLNGDTRLALSVLWDKQTRHFIIQEDSNNGTVYMEEGGPRDQDIESLIRTIHREKRPVTSQSGVLLKKAIPREEWVLPHEAVTLGRKIGGGFIWLGLRK
jgi:tyrosine-protein kinase Fes/Fps